jgi:lysophospholipase L1-like esterase
MVDGGRRRLGWHAVLLGLVVVAVVAVGLVALTGRDKSRGNEFQQLPKKIDYVALGDSYSSGLGASEYASDSGDCYRSQRSYAQQWAAQHQPASFQFLACSGATSDSIDDQLEALSPGTDLITLSLGGNDVGFTGAVLACVLGNDTACQVAIESSIAQIKHDLPAKLDKVYGELRKRAPRATVVVLGYPYLFDQGGANCLNSAKWTYLNRGADLLDNTIEQRAIAAGARFVDVRKVFAGHGACGSDPWLNSAMLSKPQESFHPNSAGQTEGYLVALSAALR